MKATKSTPAVPGVPRRAVSIAIACMALLAPSVLLVDARAGAGAAVVQLVPQEGGGLETVRAANPADAAQVAAIRGRLQAEKVQLDHGDFATSAGASLPGQAELGAGAGRLRIAYVALASGAQLRYSSGDAVVVAALHQWFVARLHPPRPQDMDQTMRVEARSARVMPFDVNRTLHQFSGTRMGGTETVTALDSKDTRQIGLVRAHLRKEAALFGRGDFRAPAAIHGDNMPGLPELRAGWRRVRERYEPLPDGARIRYATADPVMIAALHEWFAAQVMDHGAHATRN